MWDGVYRKYNRGRKRINRPLLSRVMDLYKEHDFPIQVEDHREPWGYSIVPRDQIGDDFLPGITLDAHQRLSILKAASNNWKNEVGIISVPTGGGKGEIICGYCKAMPCPTVIVADQTVVIDQLKSRLELREIEEEIGLFYAGKRPSGETVIVGSIQSVTPPTSPPEVPKQANGESDDEFTKKMEKWEKNYRAYKSRKKNAAYLQKYIKKAEMLLVDECDKASSDQYKRLFRHYFKGRRRYGFSGTPFDSQKPIEAMVVEEHCGPILVKIGRRVLEKIGRIIKCRYKMIAADFGSNIKDASAYDIARDDYMTHNPAFHKLVAGLCRRHKGEGTLVLVDREPLGHALVELIEKLGMTCHFVYGKTPKRRRDEVRDENSTYL
jgi:superfamily II DNA or RNA helicase